MTIKSNTYIIVLQNNIFLQPVIGIQHILYDKNHAKKLKIKVFLEGHCKNKSPLFLTNS